MIYASHLLEDEKMKKLREETQIGIEAIEFSVSENLDDLDEKIKSYKARMDDMGFEKLSVHGPFLDLNPAAFDKKIKKITMERFEQAYEAACGLGADKIVFHTGFIPKVYYLSMWPERVADFFNEFMEGKRGIQVLLENVYDPEPEPVIRIKELVESGDFHLCLDLGHANCYSEIPVSEWIKKTGKYVKHLHIHNNNGSWDDHKGVHGGNLPPDQLGVWIKKYISDATATIECSEYEDVKGWYQEISSWKIF